MIQGIFKKKTGVLLFAILLCAAGVYLLSQLPVLMYPQTERPFINVRYNHPGMSALDFQQNYAERIESRLLGMDNLESLATSYSSDSSSFDLEFDWNIQSEDARELVESTMQNINSLMPRDLQDNWHVRYWQSENAGFVVLGVLSESTRPEQLYTMLASGVEPYMARITDIDEYGIYNVEELHTDISLDHKRMLSYGITINDVNNALQSGFTPVPIGTIEEGDQRYSVRHVTRNTDLNELYNLEVKLIGNTSITLDDISDIDIRYTVPDQVFFIERDPAIQITATPVDGGNLTKMSHELVELVESARADGRLPEDCEFVFYLDPARYIQNSIDNVVRSALIGGFLAIVIVFLILGELRNTLIIALSLPLSIIWNFILMYAFGMSLNLISLGGLALAVGMIIDSTIVVMENIHRWRDEADAKDLTPHAWKQIVIKAVKQVQSPVIASTLTSVLVFLPVSFTSPLTNAILGDQARTVIFSLLCSVIVSLTLVPLIAWMLFRKVSPSFKKGKRGITNASAKVMARLRYVYKKVLGGLLKSKWRGIVFLFSVALVLGGSIYFLLPDIPKEIIATPRSNRLILFFRNSDVTDTVDVVRDILPDLQDRVDECLGNLKAATYASVRGRWNQIFIDLHSAADSDKAIELMEDEFVTQGASYFNVISWDPAALPLPFSFAVQVSVNGPDPVQNTAILDEMQTILNDARIYRRIFTDPNASITRELILTSRLETINNLRGWTESSLLSEVRRILNGTSSTSLQKDNIDIDVYAAYPKELTNSREKLINFLVPFKSSFVPLKHFFNFEDKEGISQVYSEDGQLAFKLYGMLSRDASDEELRLAQEKADTLLKEKLVLPEGYSYMFDEPREEMNASLDSLFMALVISVVLIYLLLVFQFNSLRLPFVILVTIPLGLIGVILALRFFNSTLNLNSLLGTILLSGIVVNNAIIMIDFYLQIRPGYKDPIEALLEAAGLRFQPILITTLTTVIGMLPLAMGLGEGANILQPLGIAISGGLAVSTILTLFAVPAILRLGLKHDKHTHKLSAEKEISNVHKN